MIQRAEEVVYRSSNALPGVVTMHVKDSSRLWRNFHETFTICRTKHCQGKWADWVYRGRSQRAHQGLMMLMEPGEVHCNLRIGGPLCFDTVLLPAALVESHAREMGATATTHLLFAQVDDPELYGALEHLIAATSSQRARLEQESRLSHFLSMLLCRYSETPALGAMGAESAAVRRIRDYLHDSPTENVSLATLADLTGLSRCHVVHAFTRALGIPPHEYQLLVRIERARHLLERGGTPAAVAADLGFADQSHFGRHFRRVVGLAPRRYQDAVG